jgi:hypothetical protein
MAAVAADPSEDIAALARAGLMHTNNTGEYQAHDALQQQSRIPLSSQPPPMASFNKTPPVQITYRPTGNYRRLAPAPFVPRQTDETHQTNFFDLPAEIRVEIYKLVLHDVIIHILPLSAEQSRHCPHPLVRTSRQARNEVLPIIHSTCAIRANVTDFNFTGLLEWMRRIPPTQLHHLVKNDNLEIKLCTTAKPPRGFCLGLRQWLQQRADKYRPQARWKYSGATPPVRAVSNDLRRRAKRMPEEGKRSEFLVMLEALKVQLPQSGN